MLFGRLPRRMREQVGEYLLLRFVKEQRRAAGLREERIALPNGVVVHYGHGGQGKETIVLLHGFTADRFAWYRFARELTARYRVIIPDLPPFGESLPTTAPSTVGAHVAVVRDLMRALGIPRAHLLGNSMGGHVATLLAAEEPEKLLSLGLLCPAGIAMPEPSAAARRIATGENSFSVRSREDLAHFMGLLFSRVPPGLSLVEDEIVRRETARADKVDDWLKEYLGAYPDLEPLLSKIAVPTLVLWGAKDGIIDRSCLQIFQKIPGSTGILLENVGHLPMIEAPRATAEHYLRFLAMHGTEG